MDEEAPKRGRRRGLRRWLWLAVPLFPAAALLAVNLWLGSPWGCSWIAEKIRQRVGLEARIGNASITPWNGIRIQGLEILQAQPLRQAVGEPLLRVECLKLTPVWKAWLRGRTEIQAIDLDFPCVVLPVELMAHLARGQASGAAHPVAVHPPPAVPVAPTEKPSVVPQAPLIPPPAKPALQLPPTGWLRVRNASFRFVSASRHRDFLKIAGISGEVPVSGDSAQSLVRIAELRIADDPTISNLEAKLDWRAPFLTLQPLETRTHGVMLHVAGQLALVSGLPLQVEVAAPRQALPPLELPRESLVEAGNLTASARFRGFLAAPRSWQGECVLQCENLKACVAGREAAFDRGFMVSTLQGGVLMCRDARLIGDPLSLLGNAAVLADGRLAGVLRVVAAPETTESIARHLVPDPTFTPLSTPQRLAFDLHTAGNLQQVGFFQENAPDSTR